MFPYGYLGIGHTFVIEWSEISYKIKLEHSIQKYEKAVKDILENNDTSYDFEYLIEDNRIAFIWYKGVVDNWVAIVYDPTGLVEYAGKFMSDWSNWDDPELQNIKKLFGGDLYHCEKIKNNWYFCYFT